MLDDSPSGDFASNEDVFGNAEIWEEFELLKNDPDPSARASRWIEIPRERRRAEPPRSRLSDTSQNLHQGRLARSVFANEHINGAFINGEIDLIECQSAWITLGDLFGEDDDLVPIRRVCSSVPLDSCSQITARPTGVTRSAPSGRDQR